MSEKQFDIFDEHFRNAAEQHEPEFSEAAWKKMEEKLDGENKRRKPIGWFWWFSDGLIVATMIFIAINLYNERNNANTLAGSGPGKDTQAMVTTTENTEAKTSKQQTDIVPADTDKSDAVVIGTDTKTNTTSDGNPVTAAEVNRVKSNSSNRIQKSNIHTVKDHRSDHDIAGVHPGSNKIGEKNSRSNRNKSSATDNDILNSQTAADKLKAEETPAAGVNSTDKNVVSKDVDESKSSVENKVDMTVAISVPLKDTAAASNNKETPSKKKSSSSPSQSNNRFFLHAGGGPEWSFVPGNPIGKATPVYGGGVGYVINRHWSIQAGIYATKKDYQAGGDDYKAKPGSYFYNLKINSVEALCNITEIPVAVNYTFLQKKRSSLFATVAFSSLIMKREEYHYDYEHANGTPGYWKGTYKTGNFYPFAVGMLSAGYKFNLAKSFSITAAPYLKLPIYGIGEGSVKLGSTGILAGLQYELPSLRKQQHK